MLLINFGHPFAQGVVDHVESIVSDNVRVVNIRTQADVERGFGEQAKALLAEVPLTPDQWQTERFIISLPGLAPLAGCVLAEIHGRCGYFPTVLRLKPVPGVSPPQFVFAELIDLHILRNTARTLR